MTFCNKVRRLLEHKQQAWEIQLLRREITRHFDFDSLVGRSPAMKEVLELIKKVAPTNATVLIAGESGTGKEVVARLIHSYSTQKDHVFLPVNCSAIPETLLGKSTLWLHQRRFHRGSCQSRRAVSARTWGNDVS